MIDDPARRDEYAPIADVYDLWSADMTADVPFYVAEAVASGGPVLEVGVGTGRVALAVAQAGIDVVGIDVSASMLAHARERAVAAGLEDRLELHIADMRDFDLGRTFSLAILPYRVFCHALTTEQQFATLQAIRQHLVPGGRLVMNVPVPRGEDLQWLDGLRCEGEFRLDDGSRAVLWRQGEYHPGTQLLSFRMVVDHLDDANEVRRRVHGTMLVRQPSPGEIDHALARAGYEIGERWGWFDRRAMDADAIEYVVSAVRADRWSRTA